MIYSTAPLPILESRLDWLTVTVKSPRLREIVKGRTGQWFVQRKAEGHLEHRFATPLYTGRRINGLSVGERRDDMLVNLSGPMAQRFGPLLMVWADSISRLDAQVTVQDPDLSHGWAVYVDALARMHPSVKAGETHTRFISSTPSGSTSYIGAPASTRMLRCYDKHAESKGEYGPGTWRFEVQWRHVRASRAAESLLERQSSPAAVLGAVCTAYLAYDIALPMQCLPSGWKDANIKVKTDLERRLEWLNTSIAPCISEMIDAVGLTRVLSALRLDAITDTLESQARMIEFGCTGLASVKVDRENLVLDSSPTLLSE
jgi:hypothetical protein